MRTPVLSSSAMRAIEKPLIENDPEPDALMKKAAACVADAAEALLKKNASSDSRRGAQRMLVLAGAGGNGGDGLYAGAMLRSKGYDVDAVLVDARRRTHKPAQHAFKKSGGVCALDLPSLDSYDLIIDAITGLGGSTGLSGLAADCAHAVYACGIPVLSVDTPSGLSAQEWSDNGDVVHIVATETLTFGAYKPVHVFHPACGTLRLAKIPELDAAVRDYCAAHSAESEVIGVLTRAEDLASCREAQPCPGPRDNKYTTGVVSVCAGSEQYPGAGVLAVSAAVRATSGMVRYVGDQKFLILRCHPEVVCHDSFSDVNTTQAWVFGPGIGVTTANATTLRGLLQRVREGKSSNEVLILDADALRILSEDSALRERVAEVARERTVILTPHDGECLRLMKAMIDAGDIDRGSHEGSRLERALIIARALHVVVVLKGWATIIATPNHSVHPLFVQASHSWTATPGTGDVLSGIVGAMMAWCSARAHRRGQPLREQEIVDFLETSVKTLDCAAAIAATTASGMAAPCAGDIVAAIPEAAARIRTHVGIMRVQG